MSIHFLDLNILTFEFPNIINMSFHFLLTKEDKNVAKFDPPALVANKVRNPIYFEPSRSFYRSKVAILATRGAIFVSFMPDYC